MGKDANPSDETATAAVAPANKNAARVTEGDAQKKKRAQPKRVVPEQQRAAPVRAPAVLATPISKLKKPALHKTRVVSAQKLNGKRAQKGFTEEEKRFMADFTDEEKTQLHQTLADVKSHTKEPRRLRVLRSNLPFEAKTDIVRQLEENESHKYEEWVDRALKLPFGKYAEKPGTGHDTFIKEARKIMDDEITGHAEAKHEVLRLLCSWLQDGSSGFAIGLEGEAGVGKTCFVKHALAKCMRRPFCFISLGGSSDASGLLGHSYTYEGAIPGRLSSCLTSSEVMDPVIFFDELDKVSTTGKGEELVHALIHLTDPVQNSHMRDRYFHGLNLDFSRAVLVFSYNHANRVNPILLDRLKRIHMKSPSMDEKHAISMRHLVPRALKNSNLFHEMQQLSPDIVEFVVARNSHALGMRGIEKDLEHIIRSYALVKTWGSTDVLGLSLDVQLDLAFATHVLSPMEEANSTRHHFAMYT